MWFYLSILYSRELKSNNKNMVGRRILEAVRWRTVLAGSDSKAFIKFKGQRRRIKDGQETVGLLPVLFSCKFCFFLLFGRKDMEAHERKIDKDALLF